jgi:hypothetical protein
MRFALPFIFLVSVLTTGTARAGLIGLEYTASIASAAPNNWLGEGPLPSSLVGSFQIDTSTFASASYTFTSGPVAVGGNVIQPDEPVLTGFAITGLRRSNATLYADGNLLAEEIAPADVFSWSIANGELYTGNAVLPLFGGCSCDFGSFGALITQAALENSADPIDLLLLNFRAGSPFRSVGPWGVLIGSVTVETRLVEPHSVPEPGTLALFGLGLAGVGFARRRRVTT